MTWSYVPSALATSAKDQVRRLIGDVILTDQQIMDEEINFALTQRSSIYGAAADCCRFLQAQFSRKIDLVTQSGGGGALKSNFSAQSLQYGKLAALYEAKAVALGGALPYAGGISVSDKQNQELDTDRVQPDFTVGMEDNLIPVSPLESETADADADTN